jgi:RNA polymerase sigma-70 factor (ECF subfamily)
LASVRPATELVAGPDFQRIHEQYADFAWRSLQRLGVRSADLEDALQEVFIVVHRRLATFDGSSRFSTWLFGICLRVASGERRRAHVRRERSTDTLDESPDSRPGSDPEQTALRHEAERRLELALNGLSLERRAVFVMFEIEGMPAGAIADMLGIPIGTVYSRLSTARAEFSRAVERLTREDTRRGIR